MYRVNTEFTEVFDSFKFKIIDYEFLDYTEEEESIIMTARLKSALVKFGARKKNIKADYDMEEFNRELTEEEIDALSYWLVYEWITPKINNIELFEYKMSVKDYTRFSEANHLKELVEIQKSIRGEAMYWTNQLQDVLPEE